MAEQSVCSRIARSAVASLLCISQPHFKKLGNDLLALTFDQLKQSIEQKILFDLEVEE